MKSGNTNAMLTSCGDDGFTAIKLISSDKSIVTRVLEGPLLSVADQSLIGIYSSMHHGSISNFERVFTGMLLIGVSRN